MLTHSQLKQRLDLIRLIPDHVAAWKEGNKEPLIKLRIELGRREWHIHTDEKGMKIGHNCKRDIYVVNPDQREYYTGDRRNGTRCFVLGFGAFAWTRLLVYTTSLDEALEECGAWLADHAPGLIMPMGSPEHLDLIKEYCSDHDLDYDSLNEPHNQERFWGVCEQAESDLTSTESGFITSHEWTILLENPDTETLYQFIHGG